MELEIIDELELPGSPIELGLRGRLDSHTAPGLETRLEQLLPGATQGLLMDFSQLEYLSSAGIRSLFTAQARLMAKNARLWVLAPQPAVRKVLETVRILAPGAIIENRDDVFPSN